MDSSEKKSVFQLVLSTKGKRILEDRLLEATTPISLIIAIGADGRAASADDTALHKFKMQVKPILLASDNELRQGLHINAIFPASNEEFDIKEIGLIIENSEKEENILFGRYANEKVIAKMTSQVDLLLDIVVDIGSYSPTNFLINSDDYKPAFSLAKATQHRYGNVRFASEMDILQKETNLALSIDALNYSNIFPKTALSDSWSKPKVFQLETSMKNNKFVEFSIIGLSFIPRENSLVGILLVPRKSVVEKIKRLTTFFYSLDESLNETSYTYDLCIYSHCDAVPIRKTNNRTLYLVSVKNEKNNKFSLHTFESKDLNTPGGNDSIPVLEDLDFSPGSIFYFNDTAYSLGGSDNPNNTIYYGEKNSPAKSLTLVNSRKKPLIHLIHDKVYILGGSQASDNYTSVEIFDPINNRSFAPFTSQIDEISNTENVTSCVLENNIYVFFIKQFEKEYKRDKFYYCYDYLGNNWKKRAIAQDIQLDNPEKNLQGKAITIGEEIYLFFTNTISGDNKNELSVIKLQPI